MDNATLLVSQIKDILASEQINIDTVNPKFITIFNEIAGVVSSKEMKKKNASIEYVNDKIINEVVKFITGNIEQMINDKIIYFEEYTTKPEKVEEKVPEKILTKTESIYVNTHTFTLNKARVSKLVITDLQVKCYHYNITKDNNSFIITEKVFGEKDLYTPEKKITITPGFYTGEQFKCEVRYQLHLSDLIYTYQIDIDDITGKIFITTLPFMSLSKLRNIKDEEPKLFKLSGNLELFGTKSPQEFTNLFIGEDVLPLEVEFSLIPVKISVNDNTYENFLKTGQFMCKEYSPYYEKDSVQISIVSPEKSIMFKKVAYILQVDYFV